jgi:nucleotide-binding universal stress UspA family protein
MDQQEESRIVVGLDCSVHDDTVLAAALIEADRRAATLRVVHTITITMQDIATVGQPGSPTAAEQAAHVAAVRSELCHQVDATAQSLGVSVLVGVQVERGDPATCLLGAARDADLIVAGTRSTGTGSPLLLGTVSQDIAVHALCPVLLIPAKT